ncbi:hypothetical protein D3C80_2026960 [compost metagenome]
MDGSCHTTQNAAGDVKPLHPIQALVVFGLQLEGFNLLTVQLANRNTIHTYHPFSRCAFHISFLSPSFRSGRDA